MTTTIEVITVAEDVRPSLPQGIAKSAARLKLERRRQLIAELASLERELVQEGVIRRPVLVTKAGLERGERRRVD